MRRGVWIGAVILGVIASAFPAQAELDDLKFRLHEGERSQQRWDNLAGPPFVRPPLPAQAQGAGSNRVIRLNAGEAATLLLPGGSDLLLRGRGETGDLSDVQVMLSQDGAGWLSARRVPNGQGRWTVPAPGAEAYLARVRAPDSGPVRFAAFRSRAVPVPAQRLYRHDVTPDPEHRLRVGARRTAVRDLAPGETVSLTVEGPTRLALRHRRLAPALPTDLTTPYRLVMRIDGERERVYRGRAREERDDMARLDGHLVGVATSETAYLQVPAGQHRITVETSARVVLRVLRRQDPDYLLSRPANWGVDPVRLYGELPGTPLGDDALDFAGVPGLERALRARLRTVKGARAGTSAAATLAARADETPFPDEVRRAASDIRGGRTFWRDLVPRNARERVWSTAYVRPGEFRGPLTRAATRPVTTTRAESRAAALRTQTFSALGGQAPEKVRYHLPERPAPSELRVYAARGRLDQPVTLTLHLTRGTTRRLRVMPDRAATAPAPEASPAMAALRELTAGRGGASAAASGTASMGTLGGRFSALGTSAPLVPSAVATVDLEKDVRRVTIEHRAGPRVPVGIAYRASNAFGMDERGYAHAVRALGGPDAARRLFRTHLRRRVHGAEPPDVDGPFAEALAAHWAQLVDFLAARHADYAGGVQDRGHHFDAPASGDTGRQVRSLRQRAANHAENAQWGAAAQAWGALAERAKGSRWRIAEMKRIEALRELGETGLADRLLRGFHLYSDDPGMRDRAFRQLRQQFKASGKSTVVRMGAHVAHALRVADLEQLGPMVAPLLERGADELARDLASILPAGATSATVRARAFHLGDWDRAAARARERLEPAQAARFEALAALRAGETEKARRTLTAHAANAPWAEALSRGRAIADALRRAPPPSDLSAWTAWAREHPGPRTWDSAMRLVTRAAGTRTLRALSRDTLITAARATPRQPVELRVPSGRLRLSFRLLMPPDAREQTGWVRLEAGGRSRRLPVTAAGPVGGLVPLADDRGVGPGRRYTVTLEGTAGQLTIDPDRPMLVRVERRRPLLRLPVLPQPWPAVMAARLAPRDRVAGEPCPAHIDVVSPAAQRVRRVCGAEAGLTTPLPRDHGALESATVTLSRATDTSLALADRLAQCPPPYADCTELGRRIHARGLTGERSQLLDRLQAMIGPYFHWDRVEQVVASAGVRTVEGAGWAPHSPNLRARTPFLGELDGNDHVLHGPGRVYFDFFNRTATTLVLDLRTVDMPTYPVEPAKVGYRLDDGSWRRVEVSGESRRVSIDVGPGRHAIALRVENPRRARYLVASAYEDGEGERTPLAAPLARSYQVASRTEPAVFAVGGPALVRVDRYRDTGIVSSYREVPAEQQKLRVTPGGDRSDELVRVYELRHRGDAPRSAPRYDLERPDTPAGRTLEVQAEPDTAPAPGSRPLHGQGGGTTSAGGGFRTREQAANEPDGSGDRDSFLEFRLDRRIYDAVSDRFYQGGVLARTREDGRPTLGGSARILFPDRVIGRADGWPVDLTFRGSAFVQDTDTHGAEAAFTARAQARHRRRFAERTWISGRVNVFARHLTRESGLAGNETADRDVFTRYKADHPRGLGMRSGLEHRPFLDTSLYARLGARSNADMLIVEPDFVRAEAGVRQLWGGLRLDLSYREQRFLADDDRNDLLKTGRLSLDVGYDAWQTGGDRLELTASLRQDVRQSGTSFGVSLTWHFGGGQTIGRHDLGNGRLFRDFRPDAEIFRSMREARAPGWKHGR